MPRYLIIISCFIIALATGLFLVWPRYRESSALASLVELKTLELEYQEAYLSSLKEASSGLEQYSQNLEKINLSLPSEPDLPAIFRYFQRVSSQNGLILRSIPYPSITSSDKIGGKEVRFPLSLLGSYSSLKSFLAALYKSARFIEVESIEFSSAKEGEVFDFSLSVKMYSY